ncbi:mCG1689, isoform CRA_a, partial [Mus musculus]
RKCSPDSAPASLRSGLGIPQGFLTRGVGAGEGSGADQSPHLPGSVGLPARLPSLNSPFSTFRSKLSSSPRTMSSCGILTWATSSHAHPTWAPDCGQVCTSSCPTWGSTRSSRRCSSGCGFRSEAQVAWTPLLSVGCLMSPTLTAWASRRWNWCRWWWTE